MKAINPTNGELIREYDFLTPEETRKALERAHDAYLGWRHLSIADRSRIMVSLAGVLRDHKDQYAELMTCEMGKPIREAGAEVEKCAWVAEYYAEHAERFLAPELAETAASKSYVAFRPLGVILAIMPWNFPLWQVYRFAAPTLMAGNAALLKHAPNVPGCALAIQDSFREAGFPEHLFTSLFVDVDQVETLLADPLVKAASLTGSTRAGRAVAALAGANIKKTVLELGGSDPYIFLEDADLESAIPSCVTARLINSGQSCIAAKRCIVVDPIRERFEEALVAEMAGRTMGDPMDEDTAVGPLARADLRDNLSRQVEESVAAGARLLLGGDVPEGPGFFYPPTVLTDVGPGMPAYDEETFGPVASIIPVADEAEAVRVANDTPYGLGAAVYTADVERGERIAAEQIEAGCCFVNDFSRSDPRLPFGGIKNSGYGRELSDHAIREFVNVKTVWIK
jgi:succinate-semialdehyde dehydrogenase/glutarate-semialdehyde dehydrogenase